MKVRKYLLCLIDIVRQIIQLILLWWYLPLHSCLIHVHMMRLFSMLSAIMPKLITTITLNIPLVMVIIITSFSSRSKCLLSSSFSSVVSNTSTFEYYIPRSSSLRSLKSSSSLLTFFLSGISTYWSPFLFISIFVER